jgi:hypothetical protein
LRKIAPSNARLFYQSFTDPRWRCSSPRLPRQGLEDDEQRRTRHQGGRSGDPVCARQHEDGVAYSSQQFDKMKDNKGMMSVDDAWTNFARAKP